MCVDIGHGHPKVIETMKRQLDELVFVYPGTAKLLSEIVLGEINTFFFTLGEAESNENAIKTARNFTGSTKIVSHYGSYHGATNATMRHTGAPRRWSSEPGNPGFIRVMKPQPYIYLLGESGGE